MSEPPNVRCGVVCAALASLGEVRAMVAWYQEINAVGQTNDTGSDFDARIERFIARNEKQKRAGWVHSMCLKCFRKRWPHGKYSSWQTPVGFRQWEVCCFCLQRHKDGLHKTRDPLNRELRCAGVH
jgi:hypothetical protein